MTLGTEFAHVAPWYNLALVVIVIWLFIKLFKKHAEKPEIYLPPWKLIFVALLLYVVEQVLTVLRNVGLITIGLNINGFFELLIVSIFVYALLLQRKHVQEEYA